MTILCLSTGLLTLAPPPAGAGQEGAAAPEQPLAEATASAPRQRVAVFDLRAPGMPEGAHRGLMAVLTEAIAQAAWIEVISRDEISAMLDAEAQKQLLGCDDTGCLAEIAGALDVELIVAGDVTALGDSTVITLQLINQRFANVMNRVSLTWPGETRQLPAAIEAAAQLLVLAADARPPAVLRVSEAPPEAEVSLDEQPRGRADAGGALAIEGVPVGVHVLRVAAPGHRPRDIPVVARAGQEVAVSGALEPTPFYATWWFWTGVAVLATAAVAIPLTIVLWDDRGTVAVTATTLDAEAAR